MHSDDRFLNTLATDTAEHCMDHLLDTLSRLDTRLRTVILRAIIARWQAGEREIMSRDLHAQLFEAGVDIPAGAMAAIFDNLRARKLIRGSLPENGKAMSIDGDTCITWVQPHLVARSDEP